MPSPFVHDWVVRNGFKESCHNPKAIAQPMQVAGMMASLCHLVSTTTTDDACSLPFQPVVLDARR